VSEPTSVWRRRDFRLAWGGSLVNDAGDWVLMVALPVYVFTETGSGTATALLFVCQLTISAALGPFGGSLVDRLDLRRCLIATNLLQAIALLPLLAVTPDRVWPAYPVVVAQAVLTQVNNPANMALLPRLVDSSQLPVANAAIGASNSLARLVGAPLGGLLVATGGLGPVVAIDAASFVAVAAGVWLIRTDTGPITSDHAQATPGGVRAGLSEIAKRPLLRGVLTIAGLSQLAQGGFVVLFVVFVVERLGRDGTDVGLIRGTMAIGAVAGAILITRAASHVDPVTLLGTGFVGMGLVSLIFWNAPLVSEALWVYVVLFALSGLPGSAVSVGLMTTLQTASPPEVLGRVGGVWLAADAVGTGVGSIATGLLVDVAPLESLLDGQATIYLVCGVLALMLGARHRGAQEPGSASPKKPATNEIFQSVSTNATSSPSSITVPSAATISHPQRSN
jgi:predicted MFS family arabinose efflux permease